MKRLHKEDEKKKAEEAVQAEKQLKMDQFTQGVEKQHDLADTLQGLCTYLKEFTGATAVYLGKLEAPKKSVTDNDDDHAHLNEDAEKEIKFLNATEGHDYLVDKTMTRDQGLTFDVFNGPADTGEEEVVADAAVEEGEEDEDKPKVEKAAPEKLPHHIFVKEVVREPRMLYFKVPRLGCYMAIHLEYDACLTEDAFDDGVKEMQNVHKKRAEQEDEK